MARRGRGAIAEGVEEQEDRPSIQDRLPEMDDPQIEELEAAARDYAFARDKRQLQTQKEVTEKQNVLEVMRRHKRTKYVHGGISIEIIPENEKVRVRIHEED